MRPVRTVALAGVLGLVIATPLLADRTPAEAGAQSGQRLTVSKSSGVSRAGERVTVTGSGYDETKGIYVAFCVDNGAGRLPTPCGGGADLSGSLGASHWISSNPPSYGEGLAVPYGPGGSFRVQLSLTAKIGDVDCTVRTCSVVTRNDHTRSADRGQDVRVPIRFAAAPAGNAPPAARPTTTRPAAPGAQPPPPTTGRPSATAAAGAAADPTGSTGPDPAVGAASAGPPGIGEPQVTRVSSAESLGGWWLACLAAVAFGALLLYGRRLRRGSAGRRGAGPA
ncbi:hypothetical protein O7627_16440 [Solwaraspora sp. WMMD1047]|uniref:hypothetical protein n=1 Tax=Solwaraspora sp. WMMD1047 TaxID=3016102 RepID=UPI002417E250|nr:hypothetical protein [Solwaraspora sp. WMMD1047]MDG4830886.1 hypothetical protein [Solwaraspora sp. WMMD1047]